MNFEWAAAVLDHGQRLTTFIELIYEEPRTLLKADRDHSDEHIQRAISHHPLTAKPSERTPYSLRFLLAL